MAKGKFNNMPQNMNNMLKQAQKMQQDMLKAQQEIEEKEIEASSGRRSCNGQNFRQKRTS